MNLNAIDQILASEPAFRGKQIKKDLYERLIADWSEATCLPEELRKKLAEGCPLAIDAKTIESKDGKTVKALVTLEDGLKIETVLMRYPARNSVCVSTQVGCPMGCVFCATGRMGFRRNLTTDEIIEQVIFFGRFLKPFREKVTRVVLMGMGEPFLNFENTIKAISVLNDQQGLAVGARKISVSTVGLPNQIKRFADLGLQTNLALSLHAPTDELRNRLIPAHRQTSLKEVFEAIDYYLVKTKRKVMIEYVMLAGVNDRPEHALQLTKLLGKRMAMVNLIRYNPIVYTSEVSPPSTGSEPPSTSEVRNRFQSTKTRLAAPGVPILSGHLGGGRIDSSGVEPFSRPPTPGEYLHSLPVCLAGKPKDSSGVDRHFQPSSQKAIEAFKGILKEAGIEATQRFSFGTDIAAACGQLVGAETTA